MVCMLLLCSRVVLCPFVVCVLCCVSFSFSPLLSVVLVVFVSNQVAVVRCCDCVVLGCLVFLVFSLVVALSFATLLSCDACRLVVLCLGTALSVVALVSGVVVACSDWLLCWDRCEAVNLLAVVLIG